MSTDHPALTPVRVGTVDLPNRLAVAPMSRVSATPAGVPTLEMADYYAGFAAGGFGLVVSEGTPTRRTARAISTSPVSARPLRSTAGAR